MSTNNICIHSSFVVSLCCDVLYYLKQTLNQCAMNSEVLRVF